MAKPSAAIEQQRRGYSPVIDEHVSEFWLDFWRRSLRIEVEPIDVTGNFQTQQQSVATAFEGAASFLNAWMQVGADIDT